MSRHAGGSGGAHSAKEAASIRASFGPQIAAPLDLNRATSAQLAAQPRVGKRLAQAIVNYRRRHPISSAADLYHAGLVDLGQLRLLGMSSFGAAPTRALLERIEIEGQRLYVDEPFVLRFSWQASRGSLPVILSVRVRFPSGRVRSLDVRLSEQETSSGRLELDGFSSGESGELYVLATLRDEAGRVSRQSAMFGVFTRNPVQLFTTPNHFTQSGSAGAPRYDFNLDRWYCRTEVRWVNGENRRVNLGRHVHVRVTDAGIGTVADFSFALSNDIVIPPHSTVYGYWQTWHGGGAVFDEFSAKGDLTFRYSMSGSGFAPSRSQVWRTMRTMGYNIIRVGDFTSSERSEYRRAAEQVASGIFRSRDMTVYGVELYRIEGTEEMEADKTRYRFIDNQGEIDELRGKYTVDNWFLDVFFVEGRWDGAFGSSPTNGPADKQGDSSGLVIRRDADTVNLVQTFAHEAGHYFGLEHADEDDGCADTDPASPTIVDNFIHAFSKADSAVITGCQINTMRQHELVRSMTP